MKDINILLTSVGRRSYLVQYFKEALAGHGAVHVSNSTSICPAFQFADYSIVTPLIYDSEYIPFLLDYCKRNHISAVLSLFDVDLPVLAANRMAFKEIGVELLVSDKNVIDICNDKWLAYLFLKEHGFHVVPSFCNFEDAKTALDNGIAKFPFIIKPRWGMGSIGIYEVWNMKELETIYQMVFRNISSSYLKYESTQDMNHCVLFQQKITGQEYGLDVINNLDGEYIHTVIKKKIAMRSGETDCAITEENAILSALGHKLSKQLKHIGNLDVDVFLTDTNTPYVLEMNARFGGGYPFSHAAGVNLPKAIVSWLRNEPTLPEWFHAKPNIMAQKDIQIITFS